MATETQISRLNDWLQLVASVGVIVSLIFVGLEIQQSRQIATADVYQQRTALLMQQLSMRTPPEQAYLAVSKLRGGEELNSDDRFVLNTIVTARIAYWENVQFQYELGLIDDEQWESTKSNIRSTANSDLFRDIWAEERPQVRRSLSMVVDEILLDLDSGT